MTVTAWLLASDPAIRWQVMRDPIDAPPDEVAAERARVATEGAGARLLALQRDDGTWGGVAWNRGWTSTMHVLMLLHHNPFFVGEIEPSATPTVAGPSSSATPARCRSTSTTAKASRADGSR